jgi:hypothetical protein
MNARQLAEGSFLALTFAVVLGTIHAVAVACLALGLEPLFGPLSRGR